jgi:hypothetical protein
MKLSAFVSTILVFAISLSSGLNLAAQKGDFQPPPTLGTYTASTAFEGDNITVSPTAAPSGATRFSARVLPSGASPDFQGVVEVSPTTGVVRVTNARPAGTYTVNLTAAAADSTTSTANFTLTVISEKGCSPFTGANLTGSTTFSTGAGTTPQFGAVADFNKDGNQDYVVSVFTGDKTSVFIGNGSGGFAAELALPAGGTISPQFPAVGDFNGDGNADIVTINVNGDNFSRWLGNGDGTFGAKLDTVSIDAPRNVVADDFNNDGKLDIATIGSGTSLNVALHLGNGDGTFAAATLTPLAAAGFALVGGDFNNDGNADLFAGNGTAGRMLLGNGTGTFAATAVGTFASNNEFGVNADFNNDGNPDVSMDNIAAANNMNIFLGNGMGSLANAAGSPFTIVGAGLFGNTAGDLNGDGNADLGASNLTATNVSLFLGNGTGAMSPLATLTGFTGPRGLNFADFNNDGRQDLMIVDRSGGNVTPRLGGCTVNVTTASLPNGQQGSAYSSPLAATGGTTPYTFSATGLPTGLSIDPSSGVVSGSPTASGTFYPKFTVVDSSGTPVTTYRVIPLVINATAANVTISGTVSSSSNNGGISNVTVILTGGVTRTVKTNTFGNFVMTNVPTGNYTLSLSGKGINFTPQAVVVNGNLQVNITVPTQ